MGEIRLQCKLLNRYLPAPTMQIQKCLLRLINWAVAAGKKYPNQRIMVKKDDFKSAYCRLHLHSETAVKTVMQLPELDLTMMSL